MKDSKNISTLKELQERKKMLRLQTKITQREFTHSLGLMQSEVKSFAINKVAIPAGLLGLTAFSASKLFNSKQTKKQHTTSSTPENTSTPPPNYAQQSTSSSFNMAGMSKWMPIIIQVAKSVWAYYNQPPGKTTPESPYTPPPPPQNQV